MRNFFTELFNDIKISIINAGNRLIWAIAFLLLFLLLIKITLNLLRKFLTKKNKSKIFKTFIVNLIRYALITIMIMILAEILGVPNSTILAIASTAALAIGLTMQGILSNIADGMLMINEKIFKDGDYVQIDNIAGVVTNIGLINLQLRTYDNKIITIPNQKVMTTVITNYDALDKRRVDLELNVSYDTDIDKAKELIQDIISKHNLILQNEEKFVRFSSQNANSLTIVCRVWCNKNDYYIIYHDLLESILKSFKNNNIKMNNIYEIKNQ